MLNLTTNLTKGVFMTNEELSKLIEDHYKKLKDKTRESYKKINKI